MRGERLEKARKVSNRLFKIYHGFHPRNWKKCEVERFDFRDIQRLLGIYRKTRKPCSCLMCGNARKYEGKTRQEKKQILGEEDELCL